MLKFAQGVAATLLAMALVYGAVAWAADTFSTDRIGLQSPFNNGFEVTPHDTNELTNHTRAIYVGGAGNISLTTSGGDLFTMTGVLAGTLYWVRAKIILSTGTTATNLVGLY